MNIEDAVELLFKTEEDDGVEAMLNVDNPLERKLALKFKYIEPYHLRMALDDEDPEVRKAAAHHPSLTPELIKEVLRGNDQWLAEEILKRPDLRSEELEVALDNPELHGLAVMHPALSEEQRNRVLSSDEVPEKEKEHAMQSLIKNIGFLTYPQLGESTVHTGPKVIDPRDENISAHPSVLSTHTGPPRVGNTTYNSRGRSETPPHLRNLSSYVSTDHPYAIHGVAGHESQHVVFSRLKQRFGREASYRVVASTLAGLEPIHRDHIFNLYRATGHAYHDLQGPEEAITYLHNYLQDPEYRRRIHVRLGISRDIGKMRDSVLLARHAWKSLRDRGQQIRPEDVGVEYKKDEAVLADWVVQLKKSRDESAPFADHLGYRQDLDSFLTAVHFLTGKDLDPDKFNAALWECDGDLMDAIIQAAALDTPEKKKAFEAVLKIGSMQKAEAPTPKKITAVLTQGDDMAADIQWAFDNGQVKPVKLGGRHSSGTMMARDEDGNLMLLKPGSGKQSPAAGAQEETASQSRREACFYDVAESMGIIAVPRAELILIENKEVAAFHMLGLDWEGLHRTKIVNPNLPQKALAPYLSDGTLFKWAVLDYVCGNPDRHGQNIMVGPADQGNKIALIDHGSAFAGQDFDPGGDSKSFVPYYLRVWGPQSGFNAMSTNQKLATMPVLQEDVDEELRNWLESIDEKKIEDVMHRYGLHPKATLARLRSLQDAVAGASSVSQTINRFWIN